MGSKVLYLEWEQFIVLYCVVELSKLPHPLMVDFWVAFFDPFSQGLVPQEDYTHVIESMVSGKASKGKSEATKYFS